MNTHLRLTLLTGLLISSLLVGCAASFGGPPDTSPFADAESSRDPVATIEPSPSEAAMTEVPDALSDDAWAAVLTDLSERVGQPVTDPTVVLAEGITYNDGSLGCPEPGQAYTQALVDGFRVVLEVDGEAFDYRVGSGTDVRLCESGSTLTDGNE